MINGVSISELRSVEQTHRAHFRRLKQIITQPAAPQSDPEMAQVVRNRRQNHVVYVKCRNSGLNLRKIVLSFLRRIGRPVEAR